MLAICNVLVGRNHCSSSLQYCQIGKVLYIIHFLSLISKGELRKWSEWDSAYKNIFFSLQYDDLEAGFGARRINHILFIF